jgi:hypothetical protein
VYGTQHRTFLRICQQYGVDSTRPPGKQDLCLVVAAYAEHHKITTVNSFLSALEELTRASFGLEARLPRGRLFAETLTGVQNYYGNAVSTPKAALTLDDLRAVAQQLDRSHFEHARD